MSIDPDTIQKLAKLSRLELSSDQQEAFAGDLEQCLHHFNQLQRMELSSSPNVAIQPSPLRPDHADDRDNTAEAIRPAGKASHSLFKAPKVI